MSSHSIKNMNSTLNLVKMNEGIFALIAIVGRIATWIISGTMAWNWVEPESFFGAVGFLIAWGVIGKVVDFLVIAGIGLLASSSK